MMSKASSATPNPAAESWESAERAFTRWIGPLAKRPRDIARQRFLSYCRDCIASPEFEGVAPMIAFGFLTRAVFEHAERQSRIYT